MQEKLSETQRTDCRRLANSLEMAFSWEETPEGYEHWEEIANRFREMHEHGTSDGKPWVEPEPPIPEGWRKANDDEWERTDVRFWLPAAKEWRFRKHNATQFDPQSTGIRYIVPIDPPLTDRDAAQWPRLLVMVRDEEYHLWEGPFQYIGKDDDKTGIVYLIFRKDGHRWYKQARRATPAEIEAAK